MVARLGEVIHKHQEGIYVTMIFHLVVAIILVLIKMYGTVEQNERTEVVFERGVPEVVQQQKAVEALKQHKQALEAEVEQLVREARRQGGNPQSGSGLRNVAVNEEWKNGGGQRDKVLEENDALQSRIEATRKMIQHSNTAGEAMRVSNATADKPQSDKKEPMYTGPSVMSYKLEGRNAYSLPVPVYQCETAGIVVAKIVVEQRGYVVSVGIDVAKSAADVCLHEAAKRAALQSRFSTSDSPKNQEGTITYRFVAQ